MTGNAIQREISWRKSMKTMVRFAAALAIAAFLPALSQAACCYFSAKNADILQPAQKVFISWDPKEKMETFTVQPKFEGNALDFGMVIPTPSQPKLAEMPRDFFKNLAVYSILKRREFAQSKLLRSGRTELFLANNLAQLQTAGRAGGGGEPKKTSV